MTETEKRLYSWLMEKTEQVKSLKSANARLSTINRNKEDDNRRLRKQVKELEDKYTKLNSQIHGIQYVMPLEKAS